ncbi:unnamed protein product [Owenia fusiformis]|uniref:TIR domain-containing protein n=1 Tax=Owenia fusiformis TaxID=6347 RepID=A0A8S4NR72_OWEFU|nr:unnamed protein product [Owenia fusiformis]
MDIFSSMPKLNSLGLSVNNITHFSFDLLSKCEALTFVYLEMNQIERIGGSIINNTRLEFIELQDNAIGSLPSNVFHSNGTKSLDLTNCNISTIHPDDLFMPNLMVLRLNRNNLTFLGNYTFHHLGNLRFLNLTSNSIAELGALAFAGLKKLKYLLLDYNNLSQVPPGFVKELQSLKFLSLRHNNILSLDGTMFEGVDLLEEIYLNNNMIQRIERDTFKHCSLLKNITLQWNHIDTIPYGTFGHMRGSLELIDLKRNNLSSLPADLFTGFLHLRDIDLSHNKIVNLSRNLVDGCSSLQLLILSYNQLNVFNVSLESITYLSNLLIANNQLRDAWNIFEHIHLMPSLVNLDLSSNHMTSLGPIPHVLANDPSVLARVNISHNRITNIPENQFYLSTSLQSIDLSSNKIQTINQPKFRKKPEYLVEYIVGQENPFVCDCHMRWARNMINESVCTVPVLNELTEKRMADVPLFQYLCKRKMECPEKCECFAEVERGPYYWIHIKCSNKGLEYIPFGIPNTTNVLDVSNNIIGQLDSTTFHNDTFPQLKVLDLSLCKISNLFGNDIFNGFVQLEILNLRNNYIVQLNGEPFKNLFWLNELHLAYNRIKTIQDNVFSDLKMLSFLDLEGNQLQTVNVSIFETLQLMLINSNVGYISLLDGSRVNVREPQKSKWSILLSYNPWDCCRALPLKKWLNAHQLIIPNLDDIYCLRDNMTLTEFSLDGPLKSKVPLFKISDSNLTCIPESPVPFQQTSYFHAIIGVLVFVLFFLTTILIVKRFKSHIKLKLFIWFGWRFDRIDNNYKQYDALLSYSGLNGEWVRDELLIHLEEAGYKLCLHERDFRAGEPIVDNINNAIDNSKRTIIVLSNEFLQSGYAIYEFVRSHDDWVRGERDPVILVLYDPLDILDEDELAKHETLKTYISTRTYLERNNKYFWESIMLAMPRRRRQRNIDNDDDENENIMLQ